MHVYAFRTGAASISLRIGTDRVNADSGYVSGNIPNVAQMSPAEARALAVELLEASSPDQSLGIVVTCPKCQAGLIRIGYVPGYHDVHSMPNGDPGYPGEPSYIEEVVATCDCWTVKDQLHIFETDGHPVYAALERLVEAFYTLNVLMLPDYSDEGQISSDREDSW